MGDLPRKERERERHRQEVLEAAEAVFAEKGYHKATVQEIAERAEFAVGTIYNMFEGKTAIYYELVAMRAEQYVDRVRGNIAVVEDPRAKVRAIIAAKLAFFEENERFFQIFMRATAGEGDEQPFALSADAQRIYADYMQVVVEVFAEGIRQGVFADMNPMLMVLAVEGMTNAVVAHPIHTQGQRVADATVERMERLLFHGILTERGGQP